MMPSSLEGVPALVLCLAIPLLGPLLQRLSRRTPFALSLLDGFMVVAISGLILIDILPHSFESAGWPVVPIALCGLFIPTILERARHRLGARAHGTALGLAVLGMLLHSAMDGAGLVGGASLSLALILHRLPVGLAIWMLLRRTHGIVYALTAIALLNVATLVGYLFGHHVEVDYGMTGLHWFVALVAGSLLHVVVHMPTVDVPKSGRWHWASGTGATLAILLLVGLFSGGGHSHAKPTLRVTPPNPVNVEIKHGADVGDLFVHLALESAPVLLIAFLAAGLLFGFMSRSSFAWLGKGRNTWSQAVRGVAFGAPVPVCSCGVVPVYRSLIVRGAPVAAAVAVLISAPELGLDSVLLSGRLLGTEFTVARVVAAVLLALAVAVIVAKSRRDTARRAGHDSTEPSGDFTSKLRTSIQTGFGEIVDHTGPWILLGLALAACAAPILESQWLGTVPPGLQVPVFALLGMPLYVCASGATPLVVVLIASGASPGAALAFLLTGPATNVTTFGVLASLHGRRFALHFAVSVAILAVIAGYTVNLLELDVQPLLEPVGDPSVLSWICLGALALVFLVSLLRQGPRAFVGQVLVQSEDGHHSHDDCGHGHDHSH